jgi:uncharacterized protein
MPRLATDNELRNLMQNVRTIAVVGLSPKPHRDSFRVAQYMQQQGYRIVPVNPNARAVLGEKAYRTLTEVPEPIDLVDVFRRPDAVDEVARDAVQAGAKAIWLQIGIVNEYAATLADGAGLDVVMDRCLMVDHGRLMS